MIDFIRLSQQQISLLILSLVLTTASALLWRKNSRSKEPKEDAVLFYGILSLLLAFATLAQIFLLVSRASVNNVPHSNIDRSMADERAADLQNRNK